MAFITEYNDFELKTILDRELIQVHFQPIFSIREKKMIGFEALSRGVHPISGSLIPPLYLQKMARESELVLELDRLFRKKILQTFKRCYPDPHELILTLNFETSIIDEEIGSLQMIQLCRQLNVNPTNVVIEILESRVKNVEALAKFIHIHRDSGFHVALDDVGKGHSNFDRIPVIQPDIIKIDRSLVANLESDYFRQEIFKSLVRLSQKIGALALAEGVETESETLTALELGVDLLQGFYFSRPQEPATDFGSLIAGVFDPVAEKFKKQMAEKFNIRKVQHEVNSLMAETLVDEFSLLSENEMDAKLPGALLNQPVAEAIYVLDQRGFQSSEMACKVNHKPRKGIFRLPPKETDYSMRDYYYTLMEPGYNRENYTSEPYISPATGLFCVTVSSRFKDKKGVPLILCVDVVPTYLKNMGRIMTLFNG